jgi:hypothetical protein
VVTAPNRPEPQRPTDHVRPLPASVIGRGTVAVDPADLWPAADEVDDADTSNEAGRQ